MGHNSAWKEEERKAAAIFGGQRFWANSGERVDFQGQIGTRTVCGQVKHVRVLALAALERLATEEGVDVVVVKRRSGRGQQTPRLVVFTEAAYRRLHQPAVPVQG